MKKINLFIFLVLVSFLLAPANIKAQSVPRIIGPGINIGTSITSGQAYTYELAFASGSLSASDKQLVTWDVEGGTIESRDGINAKVTIIWNNVSQGKVKANTVLDKSQNKYININATVYITPTNVDISLTTSKDIVKANEVFGYSTTSNIRPQDILDAQVKGNSFVVTDNPQNGSGKGYFSSSGDKVLTFTLKTITGTTGSVSKSMRVIPDGFSGPDFVSDNATYSVSGLPSGSTISWSVSSLLRITSGQGTSQITVQREPAGTSGSAQITVTILGISSTRDVWVGTPNPQYIQTTIGNNNTLYVYQTHMNEATAYWEGGGPSILEYEWKCTGWNVSSNSSNNARVYFIPVSPDSYANVMVRARNICGWGAWSGPRTANVSTSKSYTIQSLSSGIVTISENQQEYSIIRPNAQSSSPLIYQLYNQATGTLVTNGTVDKIGGTLDFSNIPNGIYIFTLILDANNRQTERIMIKH